MQHTAMKTPQTLEDRKDFLSRCTRCSQCKFVVAPASQRHASACPSIDHGMFHAYSGGGQVIAAYGLLEGKVGYSREMLQAMSSCTMCGNCDTSCKVNFAETVEPLDSLYALRAKVVETGHSPAPHRELIENLRRHGNAAGCDPATRALWAEGLPTAPNGAAQVLLHIGSTLAHDPERWPALRGVVEMLGRCGVSSTHLGRDEGSSGSLAFDLGYVDDARTAAEAMMERVRRSGAATLVTFSAPALAAFRGIYPRLGLSFGQVRVLHISEYLLELVAAGRLDLRRPESMPATAVAYHDPCKLGRLSEPWWPHDPTLENHMQGIYVARDAKALRFGNEGCYDAPRALLRAMGLQVLELERHHASSYCCGACAGVKQTVPEAAATAARNRLAELADTPTTTLISGCGGCSQHLGQHAPASQQVVDLLTLLAQALRATPGPASH
jgi:Fe-S oxidoreductase